MVSLEPWLTVAEVAQILRVSPEIVLEAVRSGEIPSITLGGQTRINPAFFRIPASGTPASTTSATAVSPAAARVVATSPPAAASAG